MSPDGHSDPLLTISDIAREAGVRTSAVSNWRKRHTEFPPPADTSSSGKELFRLSEVNNWLRSTHRDEIRLDISDSLWQHLRLGGAGRLSDEALLQGAFAALVLRQRLHTAGETEGLMDPLVLTALSQGALRELLEQAGLSDYEYAFDALPSAVTDAPELLSAIDSIEPAQTSSVMEALLARWVDAEGKRLGAMTTSPSLAQLIARLVPSADTILDPAIGFGNTVVAILNRLATDGAPKPYVIGQDVYGFAQTIVTLRLLAHGLNTFRIHRGDSLLADLDANRYVDVVVADPPYNQRDWRAERVLGDARWRFAVPTDRDANTAWLQHSVHHLDVEGQAIVVVPPGVLSTGGRAAELRRSLVAAGVVEGVIALPAGLATGTGLPLAIMLLRSPAAAAAAAHTPMLFVNANADEHLAPRAKQTRTLTPAAIDRIAAAVAAFRGDPNAFAPQHSFATTVLTHALLADSNAALNPQRWVGMPVPESEDFAGGMADAYEAIARGLVEVRRAPDLPALTIRQPDQPSPGLPLRDIGLTEAVEVLRPGRLTKGDYTTEGTPVLTQTALNREGSPPNFDRYVDLETVPGPHVITQPGDVILATIGERPYAVVDLQGGAVLGSDLELLRIHADSLDPHVVAACLSSSQTARAVTGATIPRVRLRDLTLPALSAETTATLRENLERLLQIEAAAKRLAEEATNARRLLVEAVVAGNEIHQERRR